MAVKDYNVDPDLNTTIEGINIAEGCPPSGINNAIRQLMADVKEESTAQTQAVAGAESSATSKVSALDSSLRAFIAQELAKYLPLTGGTIGGTLRVNSWINVNDVCAKDDLWALKLVGDERPDRAGAFLELSGSKRGGGVAGRARLVADDGSNIASIEIFPNGTAILNGFNILTSAGGTITGPLAMSGDGANVGIMVRSSWNDYRIGYSEDGTRDDSALGGYILFRSRNSDYLPGSFELVAKGATEKALIGRQDGGLAWDGSPILSLVGSWRSGANWYRKYNDGWIEQGGAIPTSTSYSAPTITCHTPFTTTNYHVSVSNGMSTNGGFERGAFVYAKTTSNFAIDNALSIDGQGTWYACGF